jgi:hypothetical protein
VGTVSWIKIKRNEVTAYVWFLSGAMMDALVSHCRDSPCVPPARTLPHTACSLAGYFTSFYQLNFIPEKFNTGRLLLFSSRTRNLTYPISEATFVRSPEMVGLWIIDRRYMNCIWIQMISILCVLNQSFSAYTKAFDKSHTLSNFSKIPGDGLFVN